MHPHLKAILDASLERISVGEAVRRNLPEKPAGRCVVIGAGKASAAMAAAVEQAWPDIELTGVIATRYGHKVPTRRIRVIEAGHPVPDEASLWAAHEMFRVLDGVNENDLVLALISGGGSATLVATLDGVTLTDKQAITESLLRCGAPIAQMNTVRQALSRVKGGRLASATRPARLVSLIVSDIPGDNLSLVASGPTIPPSAGHESALSILERYCIGIPAGLKQELQTQAREIQGNPNSEVRLISSNSVALNAAGDVASALGYHTVILGDCIECESTELGKLLAAMTDASKTMGAPARPPLAIISGGETTVTLNTTRKPGRGGRNQETMLSFALHLRNPSDVWAFAIDTDGYDGFVDAAGAFVCPDTVQRGQAKGLKAAEYLARHDSFSYFDALGNLVRIGATCTNVNDLRVVLVR
jgi:hydroxypyruvate reductase